MKIWVLWTGYVWLIQAVWLSSLWFDVTAVDIFPDKIDALNKGIPTIYENGLEELLKKTYEDINFTTDNTQLQWCDVIFLCVGTPQDQSGKTDLTYITKAAIDLQKILNGDEIVVIKSTVPVWTNQMIYDILGGENPVVSNPEFLREWLAISDFYHPDRIVLWFKNSNQENKDIVDRLDHIYKKFSQDGVAIIKTDWNTAELIKYAANSFLATKISFINEIARLSDTVWADIRDVAKAIGMDPRIGEQFLNAGIGYGWSCFPKDVKSLIHQFQDKWLQSSIIEKVDHINTTQVDYFLEKIYNIYWEDLHWKVFSIVGLAFKPDTDDLRESRALILIEKLLEKGAMLQVFDYNTKARNNFEKYAYSLNIGIKNFVPMTLTSSFDQCVQWSDALIVALEEKRILDENLEDIKLKDNIIFDWKNTIPREIAEKFGFTYHGMGC